MTNLRKKSEQPARSAQTEDRRGGSKEMVRKLVAERTEMLSLYCRLAGLEPYKENPGVKPAQKALQEFCQLLVDYVAAGHFSLYERIVNGTERRRGIAALSEELYPRIAHTTEAALTFNDKYDCDNHCEITDSFTADLSRLGEQLAQRIELEDRLIGLMTGN